MNGTLPGRRRRTARKPVLAGTTPVHGESYVFHPTPASQLQPTPRSDTGAEHDNKSFIVRIFFSGQKYIPPGFFSPAQLNPRVPVHDSVQTTKSHTEAFKEAVMKKMMMTLMIMFAISAVPNMLFAGETNPPLSQERQEYIKTNVIAGLQHSSMEVQADYVQLVIDLKRAYPEYDFDYAIIPLMDKLKNESDAGIRIISALALYEFQDSRKSKFAVQQTAMFDASDRVARHCQTLIRKWDNRSERPIFTAQVVYPF
jgi:hypothetical protein